MMKQHDYSVREPETFDQTLELGGEVEFVPDNGGPLVEIHWDFINSKSIRAAANYSSDVVFNRATEMHRDGRTIPVLPIELELAYLMAHHVLHHEFTRLVWLVDVLLLLLTEDIDLGQYADDVRAFGLERPVHFVLSAVRKLFPELWTESHESMRQSLSTRGIAYHMYSGTSSPITLSSGIAAPGFTNSGTTSSAPRSSDS